MSKTPACSGKEGFQRMNYLLQIAVNNVHENTHTSRKLSVFYSNLLMNVSKKTVQRIEPNIKRMICKKCKAVLIPGSTCTVRMKKKFVRWHCNLCSYIKSFKTNNKEYKLWLEQSDSLTEVLDYSLREQEQKDFVLTGRKEEV